MQNFYNWLKQNKLAERTMQEHLANIKRFTNWAKGEGSTDIIHLRYQDILAYVQYEKNKKLGILTINQRLQSLRKYYEYLKEEGILEKNPAGRIYIKGAVKKVIKNQLSYKELENLYREYIHYTEQNSPYRSKQKYGRQRNIIMLSLMIWQGLHSGELAKLKIEHINLESGTIYIPSAGRINSRELKLEPHQILPIHKYLQEVRPKQEPKADEFFTRKVQNINYFLLKELTALNPQIINAHQIRASVIMYWLKLYDKRQVQYMTGYKKISSVEKYEQQDLESLTDQLKKYHPFG